MAFFSSSYTYDSQLRRKRSTSSVRDRPSRSSTNDSSVGEVSLHRPSPDIPTSLVSFSAPESHEPVPPLPTPLTAGPSSRSRVAVSSGTSDIPPEPPFYDQSTTPVPFIKPTKHAPPPQSFSLTIDVQSAKSANLGRSSSPNAAVMHAESSGTASSALRSRSVPNSSSANYTPVRPADSPLDSHAVNDRTCGLISPCIPSVERQRPVSSQPLASVPTSKHSPSRKRNSEIGTVALPTPVSPQRRKRAKPESIPAHPASSPGPSHSRSPSATNSPTAHPLESSPGSTKSPVRRVPVPPIDQEDLTGAVSGTRPASASVNDKLIPTHEASSSKSRESRARNVLRKPSVTGTNRRREAESAPTSDSEKKAKSHHPRAQSAVFSSSFRRESMLDGSQLMPETNLPDLTPAKEILVAYKKSHRDSFSRDKSLRSSGRVVAIGSEEDNGRKDEKSTDDRDPGEKRRAGVRSLSRKFSGKWRRGEPNRQEETKRSVSESAPEVSERRQARNLEARRSATFPVDPRLSASPTNPMSPGPEDQHDGMEGRVWEEDVGEWVGNLMRDTEVEEKEISNSRRLWKLVQRLSSGNLREKFIPPLAPPPVPPLPKDLGQRERDPSAGDVDGIQGSEILIQPAVTPELHEGITHFTPSVPSLSMSRSNTVSGLEAKRTSPHRRSEADPGFNLYPVASRTNALHRSVTMGTTAQIRRSVATRSSSPSSETTRFFSRSRTSSSSSYGDAIVPPVPSMPTAHVNKQAAPLRQPHSDHNEKGKDTSIIEFPPSVRNLSPSSTTSHHSSPTIPFFEVRNMINKFLPYKGRRVTLSSTTTHFPDHEPIVPRTEQARGTKPPIPPKNPRRPGHHNSISLTTLPLSVQQHSIPNVIPVQDWTESEAMDEDNAHSKQPPDSGLTPTEARPRSASDGATIIEPERHGSTAKSILTFREMTTTQRQLTEQEKNAKWEDLLQRSDKAGGTLHVGSPITDGLGLWSDRCSVAISETSDAS